MTNNDHKLRQHIREESDDMLFQNIELSDRVKEKVRQQAGVQKKEERRSLLPKPWMMGAAAVAAAVMIFAGYSLLQEPTAPGSMENPVVSLPPEEGGSIGSELSQLITTPLETVEEAQEAFGPNLLVPKAAPEGFTLSEIATVGMEGQPVRDVILTYTFGEKVVTFVASRMPASFPMDMFTQAKVNGAEALIFAQPELTELFWKVGDIQYSITGPISAEEAVKVAESAQS